MNHEQAIHAGPHLIRGDDRILAAPLPAFRCTLLPAGFHFDLPLWKGRRALFHGLAALLFGLLAIAAGGWLAWWIFANVSRAHGVLWLAVPALTPAACVAFGAWKLLQATCLLFGRRCIEADDGRLRASWRLGPFTVLSCEREFARLRRLAVLLPATKKGPKYPELVAGLEGTPALALAAYYPRDLLLAQAQRLAQIIPKCADMPPVEVIEEARDFTGVRLHQPVRSRVRFVADADGLTFAVWSRPASVHWFLNILGLPLSVVLSMAITGGLVSVIAVGSLLASAAGKPLDGFAVAAPFSLLYASVLLCVIVWHICDPIYRKRLLVHLSGDQLTICWKGLCGSPEERWDREAISDVTAFSERICIGTGEGGDYKYAHIQGLQLSIRGNPTRIYGGDASAAAVMDWEWIATTLRSALVRGRAVAAAPDGVALLDEPDR